MRKSARCWSSFGVQPKDSRRSSATCTTSRMRSDRRVIHSGTSELKEKLFCFHPSAEGIRRSSICSNVYSSFFFFFFVKQLLVFFVFLFVFFVCFYWTRNCPDDCSVGVKAQRAKCALLKSTLKEVSSGRYRERFCAYARFICLNHQDVWNQCLSDSTYKIDNNIYSFIFISGVLELLIIL